MAVRRAVVAFGGNALTRENEEGTEAQQIRNAEAAARILAGVCKSGAVELLIVHGNGPQVGNILIQMEEAANKVPPFALDTCVAMSQGSMGTLIERALLNQFRRRGIDKQVVTLVSQVLVDGADPAFDRPTKPVGPFMTRYRAHYLRRHFRWQVMEDAGRGWRKVVASPRPLEILNADVVSQLVGQGHVVIAGGGGGVPVTRAKNGRLNGVEAVIDKDYTSTLLARSTGAELLVLLTNVSNVFVGFRTPQERALEAVGAAEMRRYLDEGEFAIGSMEPKVRASLEFVEAGGREAVITSTELLKAALRGRAGTRIHRDKFK